MNNINIKELNNINKVDWAIINTVYLNNNISIGELARKLSISNVNIWKHLKGLDSNKIIIIPVVKRGKKKLLSLSKEKEYLGKLSEDILNILKQ